MWPRQDTGPLEAPPERPVQKGVWASAPAWGASAPASALAVLRCRGPDRRVVSVGDGRTPFSAAGTLGSHVGCSRAPQLGPVSDTLGPRLSQSSSCRSRDGTGGSPPGGAACSQRLRLHGGLPCPPLHTQDGGGDARVRLPLGAQRRRCPTALETHVEA